MPFSAPRWFSVTTMPVGGAFVCPPLSPHLLPRKQVLFVRSDMLSFLNNWSFVAFERRYDFLNF